jgi:hypothetical protein
MMGIQRRIDQKVEMADQKSKLENQLQYVLVSSECVLLFKDRGNRFILGIDEWIPFTGMNCLAIWACSAPPWRPSGPS